MIPETPPLVRRSFTRNTCTRKVGPGGRAGGPRGRRGQPRAEPRSRSPPIPPSPAGTRSGLWAAAPQDTGTGSREESPKTAGKDAQGPGGEGLPRSPGRWGSARQRGPESAGRGSARRGCAARCANYSGHVTPRRWPPASALLRDSARRDVSMDAMPRPCPPPALSSVLTAQARGSCARRVKIPQTARQGDLVRRGDLAGC